MTEQRHRMCIKSVMHVTHHRDSMVMRSCRSIGAIHCSCWQENQCYQRGCVACDAKRAGRGYGGTAGVWWWWYHSMMLTTDIDFDTDQINHMCNSVESRFIFVCLLFYHTSPCYTLWFPLLFLITLFIAASQYWPFSLLCMHFCTDDAWQHLFNSLNVLTVAIMRCVLCLFIMYTCNIYNSFIVLVQCALCVLIHVIKRWNKETQPCNRRW